MTSSYTSTGPKRLSALILAVGMVCVWLVGARAALSSSIYSAKHACCHKEKLADSCRTLCVSAHWTATPSAEQASLAPLVAVVWIEVVQPISVHFGVFAKIAAANHSPPLYLQHSSLLI
ncbi:MAG: hypothetical protein O3A53_04305 [Acidobacteria bacterium]|nr:hypothetical protein [Acidobacteriota bacterium]MDA1234002.1 hypothetical protein [Acidobacteriota bacterium]